MGNFSSAHENVHESELSQFSHVLFSHVLFLGHQFLGVSRNSISLVPRSQRIPNLGITLTLRRSHLHSEIVSELISKNYTYTYSGRIRPRQGTEICNFGALSPLDFENRRVPPCAVKTCAVRPVFARMVGELRAADPSNVQGPVKRNASPGEQSQGLRPRWKPGQEQNPGPENQDNQHMLEQTRPKLERAVSLQNYNQVDQPQVC